jgi:hypothetical protein
VPRGGPTLHAAEHIPIEHMRVVVTEREARLSNEEQQHLEKCAECVKLFAQVIASVTNKGGRENQE